MARTRNIKPGFFLNDTLAELDPLGRLLFAGLWCIADREGRLEDRPKRIKAAILPYDNCDIDTLLNGLSKRGFLIRYVSGGERYIQITNWVKHQQPHVKEAESTIPAPDLTDTCTVLDPDEHGSSRPLTLNPLTLTLNPLTDPHTADAAVVEAEFEKFWKLYPRRNGKKIGKEETRQAYLRVSEKERPLLLTAVKHYAESGQLALDPIRFFKSRDYPRGYWRQWVEPPEEQSNGTDRQGSNGFGRAYQERPSGAARAGVISGADLDRQERKQAEFERRISLNQGSN